MSKAQIYTELDDPQDIEDLELQNLTVSSNIGIGITTPTSKLHVVGSTLITGISTVGLGTTSTPPSNSQFSFELTSNTNLRIKVRGTDGVLRSANITLS
jgi:hypothetical protein